MNETEYKKLIDEIRLLGVELGNIRVLLEKNLEEPKKPNTRRISIYRHTSDNGYLLLDPVFDKLDDAVKALKYLKELQRRYGVVSVSDYYEMCGLNSKYTDTKYGWTSFDEAYIENRSNADMNRFIIILPEPMPIC